MAEGPGGAGDAAKGGGTPRAETSRDGAGAAGTSGGAGSGARAPAAPAPAPQQKAPAPGGRGTVDQGLAGDDGDDEEFVSAWAVGGSVSVWFVLVGVNYSYSSDHGFLFVLSTMPAILVWYGYHWCDDSRRRLFSTNAAMGVFWVAAISSAGFAAAVAAATAGYAEALVLSGAATVGLGWSAWTIRATAVAEGPTWRLNSRLVEWTTGMVSMAVYLGLMAGGFAAAAEQDLLPQCLERGGSCSGAAALLSFCKAAIPEELFKSLFVLSVPRLRGSESGTREKWTRRRQAQKLVLYALVASLGFSVIENCLLLSELVPERESLHANGSTTSAAHEAYAVSLMRATLLTPMHCTCGVITALGVARALYVPVSIPGFSSVVAPVFHFLLAAAAHGIYDYWSYHDALLTESGRGSWSDRTMTIQVSYWTVLVIFMVQQLLSAGVTADSIEEQLVRRKRLRSQLPKTMSYVPSQRKAGGMRLMSIVSLPMRHLGSFSGASTAGRNAGSNVWEPNPMNQAREQQPRSNTAV